MAHVPLTPESAGARPAQLLMGAHEDHAERAANDVKENKPALTGENRRMPFSAQPADGSRYLLYSNLPVGTGGHDTYDLADLGASDARLERLSRALRSVVLAFLDAHVRGDARAKAWLAADAAHTLAAVEPADAEWSRR